MNVQIVSSSEEWATALTGWLEGAGYGVSTAAGASALAATDLEHTILTVGECSDRSLEEAAALFRAVRQAPGGWRTFVLAVCAPEGRDAEHVLLEAGADEVHPGPVDADALLARARALARIQSLPHEGEHPSPDSDLAELFVQAPTAMFSADVDGIVKDANEQAARLLGSSRGTLVGRHVSEFYAPTSQGRGKAAQLYQRWLAGQDFCGEFVEMQRMDGSRFWARLCVTLTRNAQGEVTRAIAMVQDVTNEMTDAQAEALAS